MESIQHSIEELTRHINFESYFKSNISAAQFFTFRIFVLSALESLQKQVVILTKQKELFEMRSRSKILLVRGIPEEKKENTTSSAIKALSEHLSMPELSSNDVSRSHRLGKLIKGKPQAINLKFKDISIRTQVWFNKVKLKNSGVTISEFLTKESHEAFLCARQRFGISQCWTKDGFVIVSGTDGTRHGITSKAELDIIPGFVSQVQAGTPSSVNLTAAQNLKQGKAAQVSRPKKL